MVVELDVVVVVSVVVVVPPPPGCVSIGVVPPARSGMASGANSTFRQVGIATGIAGLGAVFQSDLGVHGAAIQHVSKAAFVSAFTNILEIGAVIAFVGAIGAFALIRSRDFVASHAPEAVPAEQVPAGVEA